MTSLWRAISGKRSPECDPSEVLNTCNKSTDSNNDDDDNYCYYCGLEPRAFPILLEHFEAVEASRPSGWLPPILQNAESHERHLQRE